LKFAAVCGVAAYSYILTIILLLLLQLIFKRIKPTAEEMEHLDKAFHGEEAYAQDVPGSPRGSPEKGDDFGRFKDEPVVLEMGNASIITQKPLPAGVRVKIV